MARDSLVCSQLSDSRWIRRRRPAFVSVGFPLASPFFGVVPDMGLSPNCGPPTCHGFQMITEWFDDV